MHLRPERHSRADHREPHAGDAGQQPGRRFPDRPRANGGQSTLSAKPSLNSSAGKRWARALRVKIQIGGPFWRARFIERSRKAPA